MACRPGWERPISRGGATWIHFGANLGAAGGELFVLSASDDLRQLTESELGRVGQAPEKIAPRLLCPAAKLVTSTALADVT
jgi:hypothetical protein